MTRRLVVINPNRTKSITDAIAEAVGPLALGDVQVDCLTLEQGPPGIIQQQDVDNAVPPLLDMIRGQAETADAFVIACYSDPGVFSAREIVSQPVFGVAQSSLGYASSIGSAIGIISLKQQSVARHMAHAGSLSMRALIAGDRAADITVADLSAEIVAERLTDTAEDLVRKDGADVIVLGCCGMSRFRSHIEQRIGIPVLDPSQVTVGIALTALLSGYQTPARGGGLR